MGITVSPSGAPSITALNSDGTVAGSEVQGTGSALGRFVADMAAALGINGTAAAAGFAVGSIFGPGSAIAGGMIGAYFSDTLMDAVSGPSYRELNKQDRESDRMLRDMSQKLDGSAGTDNLGKPLNYTGTDANLMTRNGSGENLTYSLPYMKPWIVKLVKNQAMTQRQKDNLGLFMMTIKANLVTEWIQGIARARVVTTSIPQLPPDLYTAAKITIYNNACAQLGPFCRSHRDRMRRNVGLTKEYVAAANRPINFSRTDVFYTYGGVKRTERYVARSAINHLAGAIAWNVPHKKVMGRWARAKLTTSEATKAWCLAIAKKNTDRRTFAATQIAAAKLQF